MINNLVFSRGITDSQIEQLINYSNTDPQIINFTSDKTRFATRSSYDNWFNHRNPIIYTLSNTNNILCGLIWFEKDNTIPNCEYTFAIRLYAEARGKGLSLDFMKRSFDDLRPQNVWLKCSADNLPAVTLYNKFGFKQTTQADNNNKITMVLKNLPNQS